MRIVSWNCRCTFGKGLTKQKAERLCNLLEEEKVVPDILVIQETNGEEPGNLRGFDNYHWYGDHKNGEPGGIAVFLKLPYKIKCISEFDPSYRYIIPYQITDDKKVSFCLFSVWTKDGYENYHVPVFNILKSLFPTKDVIFIGDFNTGADKNDSHGWYKNLKKAMTDHDLKNFANEGQELAPTFFRGNGSLLNDHCFGSSNFKVNDFRIGAKDRWVTSGLSDHCPIIVDFDF